MPCWDKFELLFFWIAPALDRTCCFGSISIRMMLCFGSGLSGELFSDPEEEEKEIELPV